MGGSLGEDMMIMNGMNGDGFFALLCAISTIHVSLRNCVPIGNKVNKQQVVSLIRDNSTMHV